MAKTTTAPAAETALATSVQPTGLAAIRDLVESIPSADEDPTERMATFILNHPAEEWDQLWAGLPNVKDNVGETVTVYDLRVRPSDFEGGIGIYLVCDVRWDRSGEYGLLSVSSQMSMVQLLALYRDKRLPAHVQIVAKDKPTKAGFRPIHLRYLGAVDAPLGDPGAIVSEQ